MDPSIDNKLNFHHKMNGQVHPRPDIDFYEIQVEGLLDEGWSDW
jgi:hypothetical protein